MRKPRSDSKLLNLPPEQESQLVDMLLSGIPYHKVILLLKKKPFVIDTSLGSLSDFYQQRCAAKLLTRGSEAAKLAEMIGAAAAKSPGLDAGIIAGLKQKAFEIVINPHAGSEEVMFIIGQFLKLRDQDLKSEQVTLSKKKFQRDTSALFIKWFDDQRAKQILSGSGTKAEKIEALGRAMFDDWDEAA
jgi:hypothetical protein